MDGRYPAYPAYKPSGADWLGEIPAHWDVRRLKFVTRIYNGATPNSSEEKYWNGDIPWVTPDDLGKLDGTIIRETKRRITREGYLSCGTTLVPAGSLVISTRAPIGHMAIAAMDFCTNQGCRALVPSEQIDNLYLYFSLKTAVPQLEAYGSGSTFKELSATELANFSIPFPPLPEQRAIAAYLDRETARIDALIAHKRDLLALLERQRAALISHAVTRGLNPDVPLKPSGVEWLGEIPEHWEVRRLKFVARIYNGATPSSSEEKYWNGDIPWVTPDDLGKLDGVIIRETKRRITREGYLSCGTTLVPAGSLIMSTRAPIGHLAIAAIEFCTNQGCRALVPSEQIANLYLYFSLKTAVPQLEAYGSGSTFRELSATDLANFSIPFPPLPEQRAIAAYLDRETARIDRLKAEIEASIDLLGRYRAALISAAVTGKIRVVEN